MVHYTFSARVLCHLAWCNSDSASDYVHSFLVDRRSYDHGDHSASLGLWYPSYVSANSEVVGILHRRICALCLPARSTSWSCTNRFGMYHHLCVTGTAG